MLIERTKVDAKDQWDLTNLYPTISDWEKDFVKYTQSDKTHLHWPDFASYKGRLGESPETLKLALEAYLTIARQLHKLYTYSHLLHDEDITHNEHKTANDKARAILYDFSQETAWFEPELLALDASTLKNMLESPILAPYRFHLEKIVRIKKHTLSPREEELLAMAAKALQTPNKAFRAINDADFKFGTILDKDGKERMLSHASYGLYIRDEDRILRKNAFSKMLETYMNYENTLCELLNGQIQTHILDAKVRNYSSSLEAALFPKNIDTGVYHALIKSVNDKLPVLHRYIELRKKVLNVGPLHLYDMYVPLIPAVELKLSYQEAEDLVIESVAPLGADYQNILRKGLKDQRWVDRFENKNKRSGAYSSGCYDSMPYILMNYKSILKDAFTLAHEAGHSMHSFLSHSQQPYHYSDYPIFLAEVASTFNEELLMKLLLERAQSKEQRAYLINEKIEDIRGTFFRQTMFAEFELWLHSSAEKEIPLTPQLLKNTYSQLNRKYFGDGVVIDPEAEMEWARIPHFYYQFYVYQYATGISAALALSERVLNGGNAERDAYLNFLKGGSSRYPIEMLKLAGVDMHTSQPIDATIRKFDSLVTLLSDVVG